MPLPAHALAGIGLGIQGLASAGSSILNFHAGRRQRNFQREMYQRQLEDNRENWRMANEYALPKNEVQRLVDAGMNPLLFYGNGGSMQNVAVPDGANASGSASESPYNLGTNYGQLIAQIGTLDAQNENLQADSAKKRAEAMKIAEDMELVKQQTTETKNRNASFWEKFRNEQELLIAEKNLKESMQNTSVAERNKMETEMKYIDKQMEFLDKEIEFKGRLTEQEIKESNNRIENTTKEVLKRIELMDSEQKKNFAEAYEAKVRTMLIDNPEYRKAYSDKEVQAVKNMIAQGDIAGLQKTILEHNKSLLPDKDGDIYNKAAYYWKRHIEFTLGPIADIFKDVLGSVLK